MMLVGYTEVKKSNVFTMATTSALLFLGLVGSVSPISSNVFTSSLRSSSITIPNISTPISALYLLSTSGIIPSSPSDSSSSYPSTSSAASNLSLSLYSSIFLAFSSFFRSRFFYDSKISESAPIAGFGNMRRYWMNAKALIKRHRSR